MALTELQLEQLAFHLVYDLDAEISPREAYDFIGLTKDHSAPYCSTFELLPRSDLGNIEATALLFQLSTGDIAYFTNADLCRIKLLMDNSPHYQQLIEAELPSSDLQIHLEVLMRYEEPNLRPVERPMERENSIDEFNAETAKANAKKTMRDFAWAMIMRKAKRENLDREESLCEMRETFFETADVRDHHLDFEFDPDQLRKTLQPS